MIWFMCPYFFSYDNKQDQIEDCFSFLKKILVNYKAENYLIGINNCNVILNEMPSTFM